jgi:hypothetical protein
MICQGFIIDFILGYEDIQDLNLSTYFLKKIRPKKYNMKSDNPEDFVLKISMVHKTPDRWVDIPRLLLKVETLKDTLKSCTSQLLESEEPAWSFSSEKTMFTENELIFDELDPIHMDSFMIFKPRIYPREMLMNWIDVWTRPSFLCPNHWGGVWYYIIPPKYSIIEYMKYRASMRDNFNDALIRRRDDREYSLVVWPCSDPDFIELKAKIDVVDSKKYKKKISSKRKSKKRYPDILDDTTMDLTIKLIKKLAEILLNTV